MEPVGEGLIGSSQGLNFRLASALLTLCLLDVKMFSGNHILEVQDGVET